MLNGIKHASGPVYSGWMRLCHRLYGVDGNKVFFSSYDGMLYNDNPRAVAEALHAIAPGAKLVFRLSGKGMASPDIPDYVTRVPRNGLAMMREMATSKVIVTNAGMKRWVKKFDDQYYIQTWHGDRGFKKVRLDLEPNNRNFLNESQAHRPGRVRLPLRQRRVPQRLRREGRDPGGGLSPQRPAGEESARGRGRVRRALGIADGVRVLMYAPTFRTSSSGSVQDATFSLERVRETLEKATGERWLCITRGHIDSKGIHSDAQMDVSAWPEATELLLITDLLITDYSSIGGDFMLLDRPVVYFQPDAGDYNAERGLYFDPDQSPLIVAHSESELLDILSRPIDGPANCRAVLDFFGANETGRAAQIVAERIARSKIGNAASVKTSRTH